MLSSRTPLARNLPSWVLVPGASLAIAAASMLAVTALVAAYACSLAIAHGGAVDSARVNEFASAAGERLGPAMCLVLALLAARWLVGARGLGLRHGVSLAVLVAALGTGIGWMFGDRPDADDAAGVLVFAGTAVLGGWLGRRDVASADERRRFVEELRATGSFEDVARLVALHLGPGRDVDVYERAPTEPRWLAGSTGAPPPRSPAPEELVPCGSGAHAVGVRGGGRAPRRLHDVVEAVGLELQRLALRAEGERAGVLAERERLAGDIHDTIAQSLAGVTTHLEAASSALPQRVPDAATHVEAASASARAALAELRGLVWALRPAAERVPLAEALQRCVDRASLEGGLALECALEAADVELAPEAELCLLRATQEALRNAVRHGAARRARVALAREADEVVLSVEDDGAGFDPAAAERADPDHGHGLRAMARRVAALGGEQAIQSSPGRGTRLCVRLPLRAARGERP